MPAYDRAKIDALLAKSASADTSTPQGRNDKGDALEELVSYLFGMIPGCRIPATKVLNNAESEEIDVPVVHRGPDDPFTLSIFPAVIMVECKNWSSPVGSAAVAAFLDKLTNRSLGLGILVAANGVTGEPDPPTSAYDKISKALVRDLKVILFTLEELTALTSTEELVDRVHDKIGELYLYSGAAPDA